MDTSELESQVLALSAKDRAALANRLLDSLESMDDSEFEELWGRESLDRIERSESKSISGEEVATKARACCVELSVSSGSRGRLSRRGCLLRRTEPRTWRKADCRVREEDGLDPGAASVVEASAS